MKKGILIFLAVLVVLVLWYMSSYNGLVSVEESVSKQWANVESQY
jgi:LemA protein